MNVDPDQLKKLLGSLIDVHRDNFIQLLHNAEFQQNDILVKEKAVHYVTELVKLEIQNSIDSFIKAADSKKPA